MARLLTAAVVLVSLPRLAPAATCTDRSAALFTATGGSFDVVNTVLGGPGWIVSGSKGKIATSTDFVTFTDRSAAAGFTASGSVDGACTDGTTWLLVGSQSSTSSYAVKTTDFVTFTPVDMGFGSNPAGACVWDGPLAGKLWVVVGNGSSMASSPDLVTWTPRSTGCISSSIFGLKFAAGLWAAGGTNGCLRTSPNLTAWTDRKMAAGLGQGILGEIVHDGTQWVLGGATTTNAFLKTTTDWSSYVDRVPAMGYTGEWATAVYWTGTHHLIGGGTNTTGPIFKTTTPSFTAPTDDLGSCMTTAGWPSGLRVRAATKGSLIAAGNGALMEMTDTVALAARVTGLTARRDGGDVAVAWSLGDPPNVAAMHVERAKEPDGAWAAHGSVLEPDWAAPGTTYEVRDRDPYPHPWYRVVLTGLDGASWTSDPVSPPARADSAGACAVRPVSPSWRADGLLAAALLAGAAAALRKRIRRV